MIKNLSHPPKTISNKSVKKKRKGKNTKDDSVTITKKTKVFIGENQPDLTSVNVCSYQNYLYPNLTLENYGTSNCTKKKYTIYVNRTLMKRNIMVNLKVHLVYVFLVLNVF